MGESFVSHPFSFRVSTRSHFSKSILKKRVCYAIMYSHYIWLTETVAGEKMKTRNQLDIKQLVGTAILAALVVVLQTWVNIPIGIFFITLTLVPIRIGAILYGPLSGAVLGGVFGIVVAIQVVTGAAGALSYMMFELKPVITIVLCVLKGLLSGLGAGFVYKLFRKKQHTLPGIIVSAVSAPIINTGIFVAGLFVFYYPLMQEFAAANEFASAFSFIFVGIVGLNFIVEFAINVLLIPVILRIMKAVKF